MMVEVKLPSMGDDANEVAVVSYWLVDEGGSVKKNEDLVEMTTDKAAFSVPSPRSGAMVEKLVEEGDEVSVGDVLCILDA
ncbi:MAG: biotin attachment protein [bacterium]|nr:biotin attachment protein [bacterium]